MAALKTALVLLLIAFAMLASVGAVRVGPCDQVCSRIDAEKDECCRAHGYSGNFLLSYNLIYGLKEGEKSTTELINYTKQKFQEELDITLGDYDINRIYRIGKITNKGRPRPTLLSFTNGWKKSEIIKNKKKSKVLYIADDYSKETLEKRKALLPKLKEERNKGNIAYLKYDELIIKENSTANEKRKREPSASPYANSQPRKQQVTSFSPKTNRTNAFELMRGRSNSLTIHPSGKEQ
ncbi:hypothetical protein HW555_005036 [Spodoptera exigua]|uniref:Uncharacterized protein n=1 Tax=Spodoptera exigua TaxID=7107 RepID=A0A835LBL3_SPOEX|nr:hypothetical protein HW555_005036 [Spodoptera exigua]